MGRVNPSRRSFDCSCVKNGPESVLYIYLCFNKAYFFFILQVHEGGSQPEMVYLIQNRTSWFWPA